jgi:uncharacterized protein
MFCNRWSEHIGIENAERSRPPKSNHPYFSFQPINVFYYRILLLHSKLFCCMSTYTGNNGDPLQVSTTLPATRIQSLDVLRAIGLLGALLVSIWLFGGYTQNKQAALQLYPHGLAYRMYATVVLLFEGKMIALIALVFGAGMVLFLTKPSAKNQLPAADLFIRRQMLLVLIGIINALVFLWTGDILFHLGIMGILLFPFFRLSPKGLFIAALVVTLVFSGKYYWRYADEQKMYNKYTVASTLDKKILKDSLDKKKNDSIAKAKNTAIAPHKQKKDTLTKQQVADKQAWEGLVKNRKYDPKKDSAGNAEMQKVSYSDIWTHLLQQTQWKEAQWTYTLGIWDLASMMLLGMALFKIGFFNSRLSRKQYLLIAIAALAIGIPLGLFRMYYNTSATVDYEKYVIHHWYPYNLLYPFEKLLIALAYASLVMMLLHARLLSGVWKALACTGRLALTNYLMQSIICSLFFAGYGLGYFGRLSQYQLYVLVFEIWIVQIVFSVIWFRLFEYGPAEWLWRCITHGKWMPIKRTSGQMETTIPALPITIN